MIKKKWLRKDFANSLFLFAAILKIWQGKEPVIAKTAANFL